MASITKMTSVNKKNILLNLYRNTLKAARIYGKAAETKRMAALEEFQSFNKDFKMQIIAPRNSLSRGVMTSNLAQSAARQMFQQARGASPVDYEDFLGDALTAYKKLNQKVTMFNQFPTNVESEQVVNGMKIQAKSRFVKAVCESNQYRYQVHVRFTNLTSQTLQLISESVNARDEHDGEIQRDNGVLSLSKNLQQPLKQSGSFEVATGISLPTEFGYCTCDYLFADVQTGALVRISVPPLLLSTHDPDTDYRDSCYRGDPAVDLKVVVKKSSKPFLHDKNEVIQSPPKRGSSLERMKVIADDDTNLVNSEIVRVEEGMKGWKQLSRRSLGLPDEFEHETSDEESDQEITAQRS